MVARFERWRGYEDEGGEGETEAIYDETKGGEHREQPPVKVVALDAARGTQTYHNTMVRRALYFGPEHEQF